MSAEEQQAPSSVTLQVVGGETGAPKTTGNNTSVPLLDLPAAKNVTPSTSVASHSAALQVVGRETSASKTTGNGTIITSLDLPATKNVTPSTSVASRTNINVPTDNDDDVIISYGNIKLSNDLWQQRIQDSGCDKDSLQKILIISQRPPHRS